MGQSKTTGNRKATAIVAAVVTCGAALSLFFSLHTFPPSFDAKPHQALGETLAGEAVKLLGPGGRVIVIARDSEAFEHPATEAQMESFVGAVRKAGATLAKTNRMKVDPLRLAAVAPNEFLGILRDASEHDVVASFLGPPAFPSAHLAKTGGKHARVVALCSGTMPDRVNLKAIFDSKLLDAAIISQRVVASPAPAMDTPQAWFDHFFQVITPANLADLPPPAAALR